MAPEIIRLGIVGLDGHGPVFANAVNADGKMEGARVTHAMCVPSVMIPEEKLAENVEKTRALGVEIVEDPDELAAAVDGILINHDDGSKHLELATRFADKGKPLFVDKPFEATAEKAGQIVALCRQGNTPVMTASALRFSPEIRRVIENVDAGRMVSAMAYAPHSPKPTMPGWIYYAIHAVEPLYTLMGPGCVEVRSQDSESGPVAVGTWEDGRLGIAKAIANSARGYGFVAWQENAVEAATVDVKGIYDGLLSNIKSFMQTGEAPADPIESVEVIAFLEAANASMAEDGAPAPVRK